MSMLKFAFSEQAVVDVFSEDKQSKFNPNSEQSKAATAQFKNTVEAAKRVIKKSSDFMYVRTRAIGSLEKWGPNMNGDAFPMKELTASYRTFVGKGNFIDHKSDDITMIRGLVIDAFLNTDDHCVECLIAVDKKSHPQLARDIETGVVNSVSMGTRVGWSECSCCGNVARTEKDYCSHVQQYKGMKVGFLTNNATHKFGKYAVHEVNHDLEFIELSWVAVPAFSDAYVLEKVASLKSGVGSISDLKVAVDNGVIGSQHNGFSELENEMQSFASQRFDSPLSSIAEAAACKDTECEFDARKSKLQNRGVKVAGEMNRVRIVREEIGYRTLPKDYSAKGSVVLDNKEFSWWASSPDKQKWHVSLDEGLSSISANGQMQIVKAINEMIAKSIDNTDLVVASSDKNFKTAYLNNNVEDPLMKKPLDEIVTESDRQIYDNKDLELSIGGDGRDHDVATFEQTAKEGPSGAIGKNLPKKDQTLNHDELKMKEEYKRAFLKYLVKKRMGKAE